ncbi:MAG: NUDIX domain-containing protein [Alphaproteobacteria bacterium]|nr:NUDIX domain-containing protein [Alphaproteobacteria bacterium]
MEVIKKIEEIFCRFTENNYTKIFVSLFDGTLTLLSYIDKNTVELIEYYLKDYFIFKDNNLYLKENYNTPQKITEVFGSFAIILQEKGILKIRGENILLQSNDGRHDFGYVDRSLLHVFGLRANGVHLNAYVEKGGQKYLWISRRSKTKLHDPNKLDNLAAGAVSLGFSLRQTLIKEANEEAGIPQSIAEKSSLVKTIAYKVNKYGGVRNDIVHIFEMQLPENFTPIAIDGEVEEFFLFDAASIEQMLIENFDSFKYNSALTIMYFLYSHNLIKNSELFNFLQSLFVKMSS